MTADVLERALIDAARRVTTNTEQLDDAIERRNALIRKARELGYSTRAIQQVVGISAARIAQIGR